MVNYACAFSQSELGKYFECIIKAYMYLPFLIVLSCYSNNIDV